MSFLPTKCRIDPLSCFNTVRVTIDVLRLDLLHPVVSGNKWFKLKEYLGKAEAENKTTLLTFGGPFSNHIVATAAAAKQYGLKSIGIIRGEKPATLSHTLLAAKQYGMDLFFVSRDSYRDKVVPQEVYETQEAGKILIVPEGGYGVLGAKGAAEILHQRETKSYSHIISAVGTGTTIAGLALAARVGQQVLGVPVLKNAFSLQDEIQALLPAGKQNCVELLWDYHFGGYAKHTEDLLRFMNDFYRQTGIATDFVYTGKAFFAAFDQVEKGRFPAGSKLLLVHTGGLQGNASLKKEALIFG